VPETLGERLVFVAGLLLIGLLIAAIVLRPKTADPSAVSPHTTTAVQRPAATTVTPPPITSTSAETTTTSATTTTAATTTTTNAAGTIELRVAARDDTWISIRQDSPTGNVLFEGTLTKGDSRTYTATQFHVRFGAAANVAATLNGKTLALPGGTYSATITQAGLGPRTT
jgi:cytoskeletal protein RodZ